MRGEPPLPRYIFEGRKGVMTMDSELSAREVRILTEAEAVLREWCGRQGDQSEPGYFAAMEAERQIWSLLVMTGARDGDG